jgi:hypothetical protein
MEKEIERTETMIVPSSLTANESSAQQEIVWKGGGEWGPDSLYARMYNPETVESITGEVVSVEMITPMKVMLYGVHIILQTDSETISVHLGPGWFIENQEGKIVPRDKIEIKGSRITFEDQPAIIAVEVKKGDEVLTLRDASGFPAWSGWRRREHS